MKTHSKTRKESRNKSATPRKAGKARMKAASSRKDSPPGAPHAKARATIAVRPKSNPLPERKTSAGDSPILASFALPVMASGVVDAAAAAPRVLSQPASPAVFIAAKGWPKPAQRGRKPRLLWIGDACVPTGFATVTHAVLDHLRHDWDVIVSGVNYDGSPHDLPYTIIPAWQGGDMWGMNRFAHLCAEFDPAVVVINSDPWNVSQFARVAPAGTPVIGYMPVDGGNQDPADMQDINRLHAAVWYTAFGHREAVVAGFQGARHIVPHGIDTDVFQPMGRPQARRALGLKVTAGAFIVGNLNRNQPRKRLDLTLQIFADWVKQHQVEDAYLLLHCAQKDTGWDLRRVAAFYGVADRVLFTGVDGLRDMKGPENLRLVYNCLDVQMTTTLGEGWGLTTMEGMACGIPQVVPDSSALAEWAEAALKIPCSRILMHPEINTTGSLVDEAPFVAALQSLYEDKALRARLSTQGLKLVRRTRFRWSSVARQMHEVLVSAMPKESQRLRRLVTA